MRRQCRGRRRAMTPPLLEMRDVTRSFEVSAGLLRRRRTLRAVNGVSLRLEKGEVLGLVGESGCGKSTIAKMLLGLLPPQSGAILLEGRSLAALDRGRHHRPAAPCPRHRRSPRAARPRLRDDGPRRPRAAPPCELSEPALG